MAKLKETTYEKPAASAKPNPFLEIVAPFTNKGVGTAFAVEFDAADYKREKLQIQQAVKAQGYSAREVETDYKPDSVAEKVHSTFLIRPERKARQEGR